MQNTGRRQSSFLKRIDFIGNYDSIDLSKIAIAAIILLFLIFNMSIPLNGIGDDSILFSGPLLKDFNGNFLAFLGSE